jgi:curved DNA-binding protein CbpA
MDRHLEVLGLKPGRTYSPDEIKKAFRKASMKAHSDKGGSDEAMRAVLAARDALIKKSKPQRG